MLYLDHGAVIPTLGAHSISVKYLLLELHPIAERFKSQSSRSIPRIQGIARKERRSTRIHFVTSVSSSDWYSYEVDLISIINVLVQ